MNDETPIDQTQRDNSNRKLTLRLLGFALGAFGFGFALVPLYDVICDITGVGNPKDLLRASTFKETAAPVAD